MTREVPKILFSNMNLGLTPHILRPLSWLGDFVKEAGFDGVQYTPVFDLVPGHRPGDVAKAHKAGSLAIGAYETAYRETRRSADTHRSPLDRRPRQFNLLGSAVRSPLGRLVMPETINSAARIASIQKAAGTEAAVTMYPQSTSRRDEAQVSVTSENKRLMQPRDQAAALIGAATVQEFDLRIRETRKYKYKIDTFHGRCQSGQDEPGVISSYWHSLPILAPYTDAIDLSVGRTDIPGEEHIDRIAELEQVIDGKYTGELGTMWGILKEKTAPEFITVEAPWASVAIAANVTTVDDMQRVYGQIVEGVRASWQSVA